MSIQEQIQLFQATLSTISETLFNKPINAYDQTGFNPEVRSSQQQLQAAWNIAHALHAIADAGGISFFEKVNIARHMISTNRYHYPAHAPEADYYTTCLVSNLDFLENQIWVPRITDEASMLLSIQYLSFLKILQYDSVAQQLLTPLPPQYKTILFEQAPKEIHKRFSAYLKENPQQKERVGIIPDNIKTEMDALLCGPKKNWTKIRTDAKQLAEKKQAIPTTLSEEDQQRLPTDSQPNAASDLLKLRQHEAQQTNQNNLARYHWTELDYHVSGLEHYLKQASDQVSRFEHQLNVQYSDTLDDYLLLLDELEQPWLNVEPWVTKATEALKHAQQSGLNITLETRTLNDKIYTAVPTQLNELSQAYLPPQVNHFIWNTLFPGVNNVITMVNDIVPKQRPVFNENKLNQLKAEFNTTKTQYLERQPRFNQLKASHQALLEKQQNLFHAAIKKVKQIADSTHHGLSSSQSMTKIRIATIVIRMLDRIKRRTSSFEQQRDLQNIISKLNGRIPKEQYEFNYLIEYQRLKLALHKELETQKRLSNEEQEPRRALSRSVEHLLNTLQYHLPLTTSECCLKRKYDTQWENTFLKLTEVLSRTRMAMTFISGDHASYPAIYFSAHHKEEISIKEYSESKHQENVCELFALSQALSVNWVSNIGHVLTGLALALSVVTAITFFFAIPLSITTLSCALALSLLTAFIGLTLATPSAVTQAIQTIHHANTASFFHSNQPSLAEKNDAPRSTFA